MEELMRVLLLLLILLLAACTDTNPSVDTASDNTSNNEESFIETATEETNSEQANEEETLQQTEETFADSTYGEHPYLAQVNYDIDLIIEELARRVAEYPRYAGEVSKTLTGFSGEEYRSYTLNYEIITDGEERPHEYAFHYTMSEENSNGPGTSSRREGYHFTNERSYEMIQFNEDENTYWDSFDLEEIMESDFAPEVYLTPQELFTRLLAVEEDEAKYISLHDEEQALLEVSYTLSPDKHINIMDYLLLDPFDQYTYFFNDRIFDFKGDASIHIIINTNTMLPNAYTLTFEMDSLDVDSNLDMIASHSFDFNSEIEDIIVPEEFINMVE